MKLRVIARIWHGDYRETFEIDAEKPADLLALFANSTYMPSEDDEFRAHQAWKSLVETGSWDRGWVRYTAERL